LQGLADGVHEHVDDLGRELYGEAPGQRLSTDIEDVADGMLGIDPGDVLGEGTLEALERGLGCAGKLGDLTPEAAGGVSSILGKGKENQDARGAFKGCAPTLQLSGGVLGLYGRTRRQTLWLARVLSQPCPHDVENPNCAVPLLAITKFCV